MKIVLCSSYDFGSVKKSNFSKYGNKYAEI